MDHQGSTGRSEREDVLETVIAALEQRLDVEAVAQMVEQLGLSEHLERRLRGAVDELRQVVSTDQRLLQAVQEELRNLLLDVELLKRAAATTGHMGVMQRHKVEHELMLELCPPGRSRPGLGVATYAAYGRHPAQVDCVSRWPICKAACCRILTQPLTAEEVDSRRYRWDLRRPYLLPKNRTGCSYLRSGGCACVLYADGLPLTCAHYSCTEDRRIWADFEQRILNPSLARRLETLQTDASPEQTDRASAPGPEGLTNEMAAEDHDRAATGAALKDRRTTASVDGNAADRGVERASPATGDASPATEARPPDFSQIREMLLPEPDNKFVPPEPAETKAQQTDGSVNRNQRQ